MGIDSRSFKWALCLCIFYRYKARLGRQRRSFSNHYDAIAVVVDKEPITTYDIDQTMKALKIDRNKALGVLINEKMEISQMKQLGIVVNDLELDDAINKMLAQNKTTLNAFKANLKSKNQSYEQFRTNFKKDLEKRKLYEKIASMAKTDFSDDGAKKFFEQNKVNSLFIHKLMQIFIYQTILKL